MTYINVVSLALVLLLGNLWSARSDIGLPPFQEVYDLLRTNQSRLGPAEFEQNALEGLVGRFGGEWLPERFTVEAGPVSTSSAIVQRAVHEHQFGYIRIGTITESLATELKALFSDATFTSGLRGLVIDLRFATGSDYLAAANAADVFCRAGEPLLDWGLGVHRAEVKERKIDLPLVVGLNSATSGSAEALASVLRESAGAVLMGTPTAGRVGIFRVASLSTGQRLRFQVAPVTLGNGTPIPSKGVTPDIRGKSSTTEELQYILDPLAVRFSNVGEISNSNQVAAIWARQRLNEAELVRKQREEIGNPVEPPTTTIFSSPVPEALKDPLLARAFDVLKGLNVLRARDN